MHPSDETLNAYVDDELTAAERGEVDVHLRGCDVCRAAIADVRALRDGAASLEPIAPPPEVWTRIERALRESSVVSHQSPVESHQSAQRLGMRDWRLRL